MIVVLSLPVNILAELSWVIKALARPQPAKPINISDIISNFIVRVFLNLILNMIYIIVTNWQNISKEHLGIGYCTWLTIQIASEINAHLKGKYDWAKICLWYEIFESATEESWISHGFMSNNGINPSLYICETVVLLDFDDLYEI